MLVHDWVFDNENWALVGTKYSWYPWRDLLVVFLPEVRPTERKSWLNAWFTGVQRSNLGGISESVPYTATVREEWMSKHAHTCYTKHAHEYLIICKAMFIFFPVFSLFQPFSIFLIFAIVGKVQSFVSLV